MWFLHSGEPVLTALCSFPWPPGNPCGLCFERVGFRASGSVRLPPALLSASRCSALLCAPVAARAPWPYRARGPLPDAAARVLLRSSFSDGPSSPRSLPRLGSAPRSSPWPVRCRFPPRASCPPPAGRVRSGDRLRVVLLGSSPGRVFFASASSRRETCHLLNFLLAFDLNWREE